MPLPKPKSPARIEIWRNEVSTTTTSPTPPSLPPSSAHNPISPLPSNTTSHPQPHRSKSQKFWKKITSPRISNPKITLNDNQDTTQMYNTKSREKVNGLLGVPGNREGEVDGGGDDGRTGTSMEIASGESGLSSEIGGLRERRERLERAARLLGGGGGKRKDVGREEVDGKRIAGKEND